MIYSVLYCVDGDTWIAPGNLRLAGKNEERKILR